MAAKNSILDKTIFLGINTAFSGMAGKAAVSFFNLSLAIAASGFGKVAAIGALAAPLYISLGTTFKMIDAVFHIRVFLNSFMEWPSCVLLIY